MRLKRLDASVAAYNQCHPDLSEHQKVHCEAVCNKKLGCGHRCLRKCYEDCGKCLLPQNDIPLPCGHAQDLQWLVFASPWNVMLSVSWQLVSLDAVVCRELVEQGFTDCECPSLYLMVCVLIVGEHIRKVECVSSLPSFHFVGSLMRFD